jgi:hypothetical protein
MERTVVRPTEKRLILIAPDDVEDKLDIIRGVIDQANLLRRGERLTVWYWRDDGGPGMHRDGPQGLTDEQMRIADADLVIAVFWSRLGTPVLEDDSGTAHELRMAWQAWKASGKPAVWLYFSLQDVPQRVLEDPSQYQALSAFKKALPREQAYREFVDGDQLQREFTMHLGKWLEEVGPGEAARPVKLKGVLAPPVTAKTIARAKEVQRLAESFKDAPIVCLHGLSGSGKTRLAAQYVISPQRLAGHSGESLWYDVPDGGQIDEMFAVLPPELAGPDDYSAVTRSKNLLTALRLRNTLLVLDDFHKADRKSYDPLLKVAGEQPAPGSVLLLSRVELLVQDGAEVAVQAWSTAEVRRLLEQLGVPPLPDELVAKLTRKTGGLPLAVNFFAVLVTKRGRDPASLLDGDLSRTSLTERWYSDIKAGLSESEIRLLRYFSLAEPYVTAPVLRRAEAGSAERKRAFDRLQILLLAESRGPERWAVHPFVAEHTLNDTDDATKRSMLRDLCEFSREAIRNVPPGKMTHRSLAAGIRAARYAQRATDRKLSARIIAKVAGPAKRLGYYQSLRELCQWHMASPGGDPWIKYHFAHCELILGNPRSAITVLSALKPAPSDMALVFASARILADARSQLGQLDAAISGLRDTLARDPGSGRGAPSTYRQAQAILARLLIEDGAVDEAAALVGHLARTAGLVRAARKENDRTRAVIMMLQGQINAAAHPHDAEASFRVAAAKFRSVEDRRGQAWAMRNLVEVLVHTGNAGAEARRLTREAVLVGSKIGESTTEYAEWLERVRPAYLGDPSTLNLIDHENVRVRGDLGFARG